MFSYRSSHGFGEIPVSRLLLEADFGGDVVLDDPGENWVLRKILLTATRNAIDLHQVLEIRDLVVLPALDGARFLG